MEKRIEDYLHLYLGCDLLEKSGLRRILKLKCAYHFPEGIRPVYDVGIKHVSFRMYAEEFKPILRPLSDMTEEESCEIAKILISPHAVYHISNPSWCLESALYWAKHGLIAVFSSNAFQILKAFNHLRLKGFDCDGLIEAELAIDKTTL